MSYKAIDLCHSPCAEISWLVTPDLVEAKRAARIRIDVRRAGFRGWYVLKFTTPKTTMNRMLIRSTTGEAAPFIVFNSYLRRRHVRGYLFIGEVENIEVLIDLAAQNDDDIRATLRPMPLIEQLWRAARNLKAVGPLVVLRAFRPRLSVHFDFAFAGIRDTGSHRLYERWMRRRENAALTLIRERLNVTQVERPPISIMLPVCDPPPALLHEAINSVRSQTCPDWQLCIADDASKSPEVHQILKDAARDPRIDLVLRDRRGNISAATNSAFALARHPFTICFDHDDVLAKPAIEMLGRYMAARPNTEILYTDEDHLDAYGNRNSPTFKPDFSPDLLRSCNYLNHITLFRSDSIRGVGGWRTPFDGAQDYDLVLRVSERAKPGTIRHLSLILYHWRAIEGSTALALDSKPWASEAGRAALAEHLRRSGVNAEVLIHRQTRYRVVYAVPKPAPQVAIIIPTRDRHDLLSACVRSVLDKTTHDRYDIIIVDNGSVEEETLALLDELRTDRRVRVIRETGPFNYSALNNRAAATTEAEFVCFLNNDTRVITPDWLTELVGRACQPGAGCIGPRLLYEDGTVQHAGVILGFGGVAGHVFLGLPPEGDGVYGRLAIACNYSAVTGACLIVRRDLFLAAGGFDEINLPVVFNDIDLCVKVRELGYYNVYTPHAELFHYESLSRGKDDSPEKLARFQQQVQSFIRRHGDLLLRDPCYSPHLSLTEPYMPDLDSSLERRLEL